jgi:1,4-alpha-glucan branching enzyme
MMMTDSVVQMKKSGGDSPAGNREVEFTLIAPEAKNVSIAGQFNNWDARALPMKKDKKGAWRIKIKLPQGACQYKYVVDGSWAEDIAGRESEPNAFGTKNCIVTVH